MRLRNLLLVCCCTILVSVSTGSPAIGSEGEGACEVYVFNISGWTLIPSDQELIDNGKSLVSLPRQTYKKTSIPAGVHELMLHGRKLVLQAEAGKTYYIAMGYRPERSWAFPIGPDPVFIKVISEEEARPLLQQLKAP